MLQTRSIALSYNTLTIQHKGYKMCINLGKADRTIRAIAGLGLIIYGLVAQNYIIAGVGAIPLLTAVFGFCPFYPLFKLNTGCKKD